MTDQDTAKNKPRQPGGATAADASSLAEKFAAEPEQRFTLDDLRKVMAVLRTPEIGCPWDTEQTYASIAPYTIEEAYEVADAIQRNDFYDLKDELGDHLFQVIFYSQIASEDERFTLDDVIDGATATLGEDAVPPPEKLASRLDNVPLALPALSRAEKLTKRAAKVGFDWPDARPILDKLKEEIAEFEAELAAGHADNMEDEYGDMLFVLVNLARFLKIDPEHALRRTLRRSMPVADIPIKRSATAMGDAVFNSCCTLRV
ncbi:MAG: MazG nucleotide pyrophosphohydrolase domain-containing protein [Alphaproteobacteria bacterium]